MTECNPLDALDMDYEQAVKRVRRMQKTLAELNLFHPDLVALNTVIDVANGNFMPIHEMHRRKMGEMEFEHAERINRMTAERGGRLRELAQAYRDAWRAKEAYYTDPERVGECIIAASRAKEALIGFLEGDEPL